MYELPPLPLLDDGEYELPLLRLGDGELELALLLPRLEIPVRAPPDVEGATVDELREVWVSELRCTVPLELVVEFDAVPRSNPV